MYEAAPIFTLVATSKGQSGGVHDTLMPSRGQMRIVEDVSWRVDGPDGSSTTMRAGRT